jgi:hypothetical protein
MVTTLCNPLAAAAAASSTRRLAYSGLAPVHSQPAATPTSSRASAARTLPIRRRQPGPADSRRPSDLLENVHQRDGTASSPARGVHASNCAASPQAAATGLLYAPARRDSPAELIPRRSRRTA